MSFALTVSEQSVYLSIGDETLSCVVQRIAIPE